MKAKDVMTRDVISVDKNERLTTVLEKMVKHRVSKLVVLDGGEPVGVITDGDIADELGALKNRGVSPSALHASSAMRRSFPKVAPDTEIPVLIEALVDHDAGLVTVVHDGVLLGVVTASDALTLVTSPRMLADIMTSRLQVVAPTDRVIHARRLMLDHGIARLPVLDGGKLVGIISEIDIALGFSHLKGTVADHRHSAAIDRFIVQGVMQQTLITATPEMTAKDAVALMRRDDVGSLPVVQAGRVVGIVTRTDLLKLVPREVPRETRASPTASR